ncbi:MAG: hypothetical protein ACKPFK_14400, partial [Dolichospermum sp.]
MIQWLLDKKSITIITLSLSIQNMFPESAPVANPVFYRTYSRRTDTGLRENWSQVCDRTLEGLIKLGRLNP